MGRTRAFLPPAVCDVCQQRPALGDTLWHSGVVWLCPGCLTEQATGETAINKMADHSIQADHHRSLSKRDRVAGNIEAAELHESDAQWHGHALQSIRDHGLREIRSVQVVNGEAVPALDSWLKDTLADPDIPAIDASRMRGQLLEGTGVTALAIDLSNTAHAENSVEKLLSHQMALAHKVAFQQASRAERERDPLIELKRLQVSARMMTTAQEAAVALQKVKRSGTQKVVVQHVHVEAGGQAVVGDVRSGGKVSE